MIEIIVLHSVSILVHKIFRTDLTNLTMLLYLEFLISIDMVGVYMGKL